MNIRVRMKSYSRRFASLAKSSRISRQCLKMASVSHFQVSADGTMQDVKEEVRTTCLSLLAKQTDVMDINTWILVCNALARCSALNILQLARWLGRPELKHVASSDCVLSFESMKLGEEYARTARTIKTRKGSKGSMLKANGFNLASKTIQLSL